MEQQVLCVRFRKHYSEKHNFKDFRSRTIIVKTDKIKISVILYSDDCTKSAYRLYDNNFQKTRKKFET